MGLCNTYCAILCYTVQYLRAIPTCKWGCAEPTLPPAITASLPTPDSWSLYNLKYILLTFHHTFVTYFFLYLLRPQQASTKLNHGETKNRYRHWLWYNILRRCLGESVILKDWYACVVSNSHLNPTDQVRSQADSYIPNEINPIRNWPGSVRRALAGLQYNSNTFVHIRRAE